MASRLIEVRQCRPLCRFLGRPRGWSVISCWNWMRQRGIVDENPWREQLVYGGKKAQKRTAWTRDELKKILTGTAPPKYHAVMQDLIRLALMTGCRIEELCALKSSDVVRTDDGLEISITDGKTDAATRTVPIHPLVEPIVERRPADGDAYLFRGLRPGGRDDKRSFYVTKAFGRFRKSVGVRENYRDFHALRNTFIEALEAAGAPESTTKLIVGHARESMTYGRYSKGRDVDLRKAVNMVDYGPDVMSLIGSG